MLGYALAQLLPRYALTLVDHEAGVEHIGRFSSVPIDRLIIVATPDALSLDVAGRVLAHARAGGRPIRSAALLLNRVQLGDCDDSFITDTLAQLDAAGLRWSRRCRNRRACGRAAALGSRLTPCPLTTRGSRRCCWWPHPVCSWFLTPD